MNTKQSLILFPEVSLTNDFIKRIEKRFGYLPDIWHSKITPSKKKNIIHKIISGKSKIVIGMIHHTSKKKKEYIMPEIWQWLELQLKNLH